MRDSDIAQIFAALDIVVMEQREDKTFDILGTTPSWFERLHPMGVMENKGFLPERKFFFLEGFMVNAEFLWNLKLDSFEKLKSCWWSEADQDGEIHYMRAMAVTHKGKNYLVLEHATRYSEIFKTLQNYTEGMLEFERISKRQDKLSKEAEQLSALSILDDLTGTYNQRGFLALAEQQLKVAKRKKATMLLFYVDFDNLKDVNEKFGHPEGSMALIATANILRKTFRRSDLISRFTSDEFAVLAIETKSDSEVVISARLQDNMKEYNSKSYKPYEVSLRVGLVRYTPSDAASITELIEKASAKAFK